MDRQIERNMYRQIKRKMNSQVERKVNNIDGQIDIKKDEQIGRKAGE